MAETSPAHQAFEHHLSMRPDTCIALPGDVWVFCRPQYRDEGRLVLEYCGFAQDLIAGGFMQEAWLQPTGKHLRDEDGEPVSVTRSWRELDGRPTRYCRLRRIKLRAQALRLAGADLALKAHEDLQRWEQRREELHEQLPEYREYVLKNRMVLGEISREEYERALKADNRDRLRLVVDNNHRVQP